MKYSSPHHRYPQRRIATAARLAPIATLLAGLSLAAAPAVHAQAVDSVEALKAELARVQAENARLKQALDGKTSPVADTPAPPPPVAAAPAAEAASAPALAPVTVRSRNRLATVQDVPISASVVGGDELQRLDVTSIRDITTRLANVTRQNSSNARSSDLAIRGIGRKGNSEAQDPNVGITVDGVSYGYAGLSAWDWVDIDSVELLRGPVGTLGGKNSDVGGLYIETRKPSFTPGADVSISIGNHDSVVASAAITGPVVDNVLAWRGTFYVDKVSGAYTDIQDANDASYTDRNKISAKLQFLFTPTDNFSALFSIDKQPRTFENDNGLNLFHATLPYTDGKNPTNDPAVLLARPWFKRNTLYTFDNNYINYRSGTQDDDEQRPLDTGTDGGLLDLKWNLGDYKLRSITSFRNLYFDARNDEGTPFDISQQGGGGIRYAQWTQELRLNSPVGGAVDYQTGLYVIRNHHDVDSKVGYGADAGAWYANTAQYGDPTLTAAQNVAAGALGYDAAGRNLLTDSLDNVRTNGTADNRELAPAIYGQANWHLSDPLTVTVGGRVTHEHRTASNFNAVTDPGYGAEYLDAYAANPTDPSVIASVAGYYFNSTTLNASQAAQLKNALKIRTSKEGTLYVKTASQQIDETLYNFNLSPTYKFSNEVTGYIALQHGEKAGVAQVVPTSSGPISYNAKPEASNNLEIGLKNVLLDKTLTLNADLFLVKMRDYQLASVLRDPASPDSSPVYISTTGNAAKVQAKGVEVDASYTGIRNTTLRFSGSYDDSRFVSFPNSPLTAETDPSSTAKFQDLSGRTLPGASKWMGNVGAERRFEVGDHEIHVDGNYAYMSRYNSDTALSQYGWINGYGLTDLGVGYARLDHTWDLGIVVKNAFNVRAKAYGFSTGTLDTTPRWIALTVTARL